MGKWFDDVFLPSLMDRAGGNRQMWITSKQLDVCRNYMRCDQYALELPYHWGVYTTRGMYSYEWRGRIVSVFPAQNSAAQIFFGMDDADRAACSRRAEAKEMRSNAIRRKRRPEAYHTALLEAAKRYADALIWLDYDAATGDDDDIRMSADDVNRAERDYYKLLLA